MNLVKTQNFILMDHLNQIVSRRLGTKPSQTYSRRRNQSCIIARRFFAYAAYTITEIPMTEIAVFLHYADHSAVHHQIRRMKDMLKHNPTHQTTLDTIEHDFNLYISGELE